MARKHLAAFVGLLICAAPLLAEERGLTGIQHPADTMIPSAQVAAATRQISPPAQRQEAGFPLLESQGETPEAKQERGGFATPLLTVVSSLVVVLGLFAGLVWMTRKFGNGTVRAGAVPNDVLQTLGSTALDARTRVTMLRCGNRIVVAAQTANGIHPLCEITDPSEVQELTMACTGESRPSFSETLEAAQQQRAEREPATHRSRLFATA